MTSAVGEKGQVTIPKRLREAMGIKPGTRLSFEQVDGALVARKVVGAGIDRVFGIAGGGETERILRELRGPDWNAETDPETVDSE